jgi:hypothetical protein
MNVRVRIQFNPPTEVDWRAMRSLANSLTDNRDGVRVFADPGQADWLVAEFTMPTEAQYKALPKIERAMKLCAWNRWDSTFSFPYTEAERARADRRAARRKARRAARKEIVQGSEPEA